MGSGGRGLFLNVPVLLPQPTTIAAVQPRMPIVVIRSIVVQALLSQIRRRETLCPFSAPTHRTLTDFGVPRRSLDDRAGGAWGSRQRAVGRSKASRRSSAR